MKRDLRLVRRILEFAERHCKMNHIAEINTELAGASSFEELDYHLALMCSAGLIACDTAKDASINELRSLTWTGHDLLDRLRNHDSLNRSESGDWADDR